MNRRRLPHMHAVVRVIDRNASCLLTGFSMLARQGIIRYTQEMQPAPPPLTSGPWHLRDKDDSNIELVLDDRATGFVDFHDSWELNDEGLRSHDVYFKRSLDLGRHPEGAQRKLVPLGLIYEVWRDGFDPFEFERILTQVVPLKNKAIGITRYAAHLAASLLGQGRRATLSSTSCPPDVSQAPRVLFMVGLWDPASIETHDPAKVPEFESINRMRAACVRQLRAALGEAFYGGTQRTAFASRYAPDTLLPDTAVSSKRRYLQKVREHPVCIATTGLHGSNGCKLAEYVSLSRAIVSEPLRYQVPGDFSPGTHYLPFETADECVRQVQALVKDPSLRESMMHNNWAYYTRWLRPDALARHVLESIRQRT